MAGPGVLPVVWKRSPVGSRRREGGCWGQERPGTNKTSSVGVHQKEKPHSTRNMGNGYFKEGLKKIASFPLSGKRKMKP